MRCASSPRLVFDIDSREELSVVYHVKIQRVQGTAYWWNRSLDQLFIQLLIPFVNGQVIPAREGDRTTLINMRSVTFANFYKTEQELAVPEGTGVPAPMVSADFEANECTAELLEAIRVLQAFPTTSTRMRRTRSGWAECH